MFVGYSQNRRPKPTDAAITEVLGRVSPERLMTVLASVGLGALIDELESENWSQHLSQAEQQQLAFARILLAQPVFLFLDDATSALDDEAEEKLYGMLGSPTWRPTVISASYKTRLLHFHSQVLDISAFYGRQNGHRKHTLEPELTH